MSAVVTIKLNEEELDLLCEYGSYLVNKEDTCNEFKALNVQLLLIREKMKRDVKDGVVSDFFNNSAECKSGNCDQETL